MKILLLTTHLNLGGIAGYIKDLAGELVNRGHTVYLASSGGQLEEEIKKEGVTCIKIPIKTKSILSPKIMGSLFVLAKYFQDRKIDLIHSHTRVTSVLGCFLSKQLKVDYITTSHGIYKRKLMRRLFPFAGKKVIAVSRQASRRLREWLNIPEEKIRTIANGIDYNKFTSFNLNKEEARRRLGLKNDDFVIGNVSRLAEIKGQDILIRAFDKLKDVVRDAKLLIVGEGKFRKNLEQLTEALNIKNKVIFTGPLKDVRCALKAMDVFCFPVLDEPFGLAVLEAMASNVPVVTSRVSEIPVILNNGGCGILVELGSDEALQEGILKLYEDEKLRLTLSINAKKQVKKKYTLERMTDEIMQLYNEVLQ
jgi:glycosyltransferase involved in cell wall biosynthesis